MIREGGLDGGGNHKSLKGSVSVLRTAALGDVLCSTVVADKLAGLDFDVHFQAHSSTHCILRRCPSIYRISEPRQGADVNLDGAYETDPGRRRKHFHEMFMQRANDQLRKRNIDLGPPTNCRPRLIVQSDEREAAKARFANYPRPWVFICPRSQSFAHRQCPDSAWVEIAMHVAGTKFWLGLHPAPSGIVDLECRHFDNVILWLSAADLLITVDTGPMHIAAALGVPVVAIVQSSSPNYHLNNQNDYIAVAGPLDCLNCQQDVCPINAISPPCQQVNVGGIAAWANARLRGEG